ncbi:MAG: DMT family transporter [Lentimicrobiaceae bacterium]|nr:DMT family transporter [Lentimicrobiaceae bacterium]
MKISNHHKGYLFAFGATFFGSLVYLFSKAALLKISLPVFGFWWFAWALFWNSLYAIHRKGFADIKKLQKTDFRNLFIIAIFELVATTSLYIAIGIALNPAVPSFLRNLEYVFIALLSIRFLNEKLNSRVAAGAIVTFAGAFIIASNNGLSGFSLETALFMLVATSFYGIRTILVKKNIVVITPIILAINRAIFLFLFSLVMLTAWGESIVIDGKVMFNLAAGAFVGPFLTSIFQYSALKYIQASKTAVILSTTGLFVMMGAIVMFNMLPTRIQLMGGVFTMAGVTMLMWDSLRKKKT